VARIRKHQTAHLEGFTELNRKLQELESKAAGDTLAKATEVGAEIVRAEAERLAPKGDTGVLKESIAYRPGRLQVGRAQMDVGIGRDAFYGMFHERGSSKMPARPFLRPALINKADEAVAAIGTALRKMLGLD
jgi:HK97 gp10 family phage protein